MKGTAFKRPSTELVAGHGPQQLGRKVAANTAEGVAQYSK